MPEPISEPGFAPRRHRGRNVAIGCFAVVVIMGFAACAWLFHWFPPVKPSGRDVARAERMLSDYADTKWDGRVVLDHLDVGLETQYTDYPFAASWESYEYQAYFQIKGTDAVFFAGIPTDTQPDQIADWWNMSTELNSDEVALLVAYSRETSTAAGYWDSDAEWGFYAEQYPDKDVWSVEPVALEEPMASASGLPGYEWVFERLEPGSFRLLEAPSEQ